MHRFCYPVDLAADQDGGYVVSFGDVPEAITQGDTLDEALEQATDALDEAISGRIRLREEIPAPSSARPGQHIVTLPIETAAKAALYVSIREAGLNKVELAALLGMDEKEVRRLLDPYHASKLPRIETALEALGKRLVIVVRDVEDERQVELAAAGT